MSAELSAAVKNEEALVLRYALSTEAKQAGVKLKVPAELDAGFDLPALEDIRIEPSGFALIPTGVYLEIPAGFFALVRDRSSVALRGGLTAAGVIDASYRGELKVAMHNLSKEPLEFKQGERIAQFIVIPCFEGSKSVQLEQVEALGQTARGAGGFGSSGR